jgi:hypothetical protein
VSRGVQEQPQFQLNLPPELVPGADANGAMVWHTAYEFTLDFVAIQPASPESPGVVPCQVVSRVKIPPTVIFDLMKALNENMSKYEEQFGEIRRVEPPG